MIISKLHLVIKFKLFLKIIKALDSYTLRLEQHRLLKFLTENTDFFFLSLYILARSSKCLLLFEVVLKLPKFYVPTSFL